MTHAEVFRDKEACVTQINIIPVCLSRNKVKVPQGTVWPKGKCWRAQTRQWPMCLPGVPLHRGSWGSKKIAWSLLSFVSPSEEVKKIPAVHLLKPLSVPGPISSTLCALTTTFHKQEGWVMERNVIRSNSQSWKAVVSKTELLPYRTSYLLVFCET